MPVSGLCKAANVKRQSIRATERRGSRRRGPPGETDGRLPPAAGGKHPWPRAIPARTATPSVAGRRATGPDSLCPTRATQRAVAARLHQGRDRVRCGRVRRGLSVPRPRHRRPTRRPPARSSGWSRSTSTAASRRVDVLPHETLVHTLRYKLGLTGTKLGCDHAECGACTVMSTMSRPIPARR